MLCLPKNWHWERNTNTSSLEMGTHALQVWSSFPLGGKNQMQLSFPEISVSNLPWSPFSVMHRSRDVYRVVGVHTHPYVSWRLSALCHRCPLCPVQGVWRTSSCWSRRSIGLMRWDLCSGQEAPSGPCRRVGWGSTSSRPSWGCWTIWWVSCHCPSRPVLCGLAPQNQSVWSTR